MATSITYHFKDLEEVAAHFEAKAKTAERTAKNSGPNIGARLKHEAAAYYDVVNTLRATKIGVN